MKYTIVYGDNRPGIMTTTATTAEQAQHTAEQLKSQGFWAEIYEN